MVHSLKKLLLGLALSLALLGSVPAAAAPEQISAASAIVMEPRTGAVLYEPDERRLVASTTKIMTALVVLEHCALDEIVLPTAAHAGVEGSSMYLEAGTPYTVEELLYGLLLASGNDAAAALADHCAGSMEDFAALMNRRAEALGLELGTVRSRLNRARKKLCAFLSDDGNFSAEKASNEEEGGTQP